MYAARLRSLPVSLRPRMIKSAESQPPVSPPSGMPPLYASLGVLLQPGLHGLRRRCLELEGNGLRGKPAVLSGLVRLRIVDRLLGVAGTHHRGLGDDALLLDARRETDGGSRAPSRSRSRRRPPTSSRVPHS